MFTRICYIAATALLAGCAGGDRTPVLSQAPVSSLLIDGDYQAVAACSYERLDKSQGAGIKKVDLPGTSKLALESGGVRYWELTFASQGKGRTAVNFTAVQTVWGTDTTRADQIMSDVRSCHS